MRISDWSSDVCSSDLLLREQLGQERRLGARQEDLRSADLLAHVEDDGAHPVVAPVMLARQHLVLAQHRLGAAQVDDDVAELVALDQTVDDLADQIGRAHVWTPVTNAHLVCRLLLEKKKKTKTKEKVKYM